MLSRMVLLFASIGLLFGCTPKKKEISKALKVGIPGAWGDLIPSLQHTAFADAILSNQYEPLVQVGDGGMIIPMAAKKWEIQDKYKTFIFTIDTTKKFSNGVGLKAIHFKKAWEHSLSLIPRSANNSLQDVLYKVEGFEEFEKTGTISGLVVEGDDTFTVRFKKSFRIGLENLTGSRMAVFLKLENDFLGTGPFQIVQRGEDTVKMIKNPYSPENPVFSNAEIYRVPADKAVKALYNKEIDLFLFADTTQIDDCATKRGDISCFSGNESGHKTLVLNGMKGRFFSKLQHRKAFQALVLKSLTQESLPGHLRYTVRVDPQIYLPFQMGRLSPADTKKIIAEGEPHIPEFLRVAKARPLLVNTGKTSEWVLKFLENLKIPLNKQSKRVESKKLVKMYYKSFEPDILPMGMGVISGDPDGAYHMLGKNGSIATPMAYRKELADALETGRGILQKDKIHNNYQKVSRSALSDVPFVHLGFSKTRAAYNNNTVAPRNDVKDRSNDRLSSFRPL